MENKPRRPFGVIVLCVAYLVMGLYIFTLTVPRTSNRQVPSAPSVSDNMVALLWLEASALIASAVGLWLLQQWGRRLAIVGAVAGTLFVLLTSPCYPVNRFQPVYPSQPALGMPMAAMFAALLVVMYLLQPEVRRAFR